MIGSLRALQVSGPMSSVLNSIAALAPLMVGGSWAVCKRAGTSASVLEGW